MKESPTRPMTSVIAPCWGQDGGLAHLEMLRDLYGHTDLTDPEPIGDAALAMVHRRDVETQQATHAAYKKAARGVDVSAPERRLRASTEIKSPGNGWVTVSFGFPWLTLADPSGGKLTEWRIGGTEDLVLASIRNFNCSALGRPTGAVTQEQLVEAMGWLKKVMPEPAYPAASGNVAATASRLLGL